MSLASDDLQDALTELEEYFGSPQFEYESLVYPCLISTLLRGTTLEIGGKIEEVQLTLTVRKNAIPTQTVDADEPTADSDLTTADQNLPPPQPEKIIKVMQPAPRLYRILQVGEDGAGAAWKLHLGSLNRKGR